MFANDAIYCFHDISRYKTLIPAQDNAYHSLILQTVLVVLMSTRTYFGPMLLMTQGARKFESAKVE